MDRAGRAASTSLESLASALSHNLRLHARKYESISALCRACDVNRQQFNKYLTGEALPSLLNLAKISDILGVKIDDLLTPPTRRLTKHVNPVVELENFLRKDQIEIATGYYLDYTLSAVYRGNMLVAICKIEKILGNYIAKVKLILKTSEYNEVKSFKYRGSAFASREAIYINYAHERNPEDLVYGILQPDVRYSKDFIGVRTAMSNGSPSIPFAASFYLQYLGERPDLRATISQCGLFPLDKLNEQQSRILARLEAKTQSAKNIIRISHS